MNPLLVLLFFFLVPGYGRTRAQLAPRPPARLQDSLPIEHGLTRGFDESAVLAQQVCQPLRVVVGLDFAEATEGASMGLLRRDVQ